MSVRSKKGLKGSMPVSDPAVRAQGGQPGAWAWCIQTEGRSRSQQIRPASRVQMLRHRAWTYLTDSNSSSAACCFSLFMMLTILVSTVNLCISTLESFAANDSARRLFTWIELLTVQIFAVELLAKLASCPSQSEFWQSPANLVDVLAILPWYLQLASSAARLPGSTVLRVIRLARVLRIFKLGSRYSRLQVVAQVLYDSRDVLMLMLVLVFILLVVFGTLMYYTERGRYCAELETYCRLGDFDAHGNQVASPFQSIPESMWFVIVTLMTVGYGDVVPITPLGKIFAGMCMLAGILMLALPISAISPSFTQLLADHNDIVRKRSDLHGVWRRKRSDLRVPAGMLVLCELLMGHAQNVETLVARARAEVQQLDVLGERLRHKLRQQANTGGNSATWGLTSGRGSIAGSEDKPSVVHSCKADMMPQLTGGHSAERVTAAELEAAACVPLPRDVRALGELGHQLSARLSDLRDVLGAADVASSGALREAVTWLVERYMQFEALRQEADDLKQLLDDVETQLDLAEARVACGLIAGRVFLPAFALPSNRTI